MRKFLLALVLLAALASCQKKMEEPGGTGAEKLANEWWVTLTQNGADVYDLGHFKITTYNPATGTDSLWIDDGKNGYGFKTKVSADWNASTFGSVASNLYFNPASPASFPQTVTVAGGKVLAAAGRSRTGNVTDSIYMTVEFSDDPGTQFVLSGHARTMFAEDEY